MVTEPVAADAGTGVENKTAVAAISNAAICEFRMFPTPLEDCDANYPGCPDTRAIRRSIVTFRL
jgi:hypothetical protein